MHTFGVLGAHVICLGIFILVGKAESDVAWNVYIVFLVMCFVVSATEITESVRFHPKIIGPLPRQN